MTQLPSAVDWWKSVFGGGSLYLEGKDAVGFRLGNLHCLAAAVLVKKFRDPTISDLHLAQNANPGSKVGQGPVHGQPGYWPLAGWVS